MLVHDVKRRVGGVVLKATGVDSILWEFRGEWKKRNKCSSLRGEMGKEPFLRPRETMTSFCTKTNLVGPSWSGFNCKAAHWLMSNKLHLCSRSQTVSLVLLGISITGTFLRAEGACAPPGMCWLGQSVACLPACLPWEHLRCSRHEPMAIFAMELGRGGWRQAAWLPGSNLGCPAQGVGQHKGRGIAGHGGSMVGNQDSCRHAWLGRALD